ncbi:MAG: hypothetical protein NXH85_06905 [Pseudomonadaceae bacterium]|nr:hypothetical protein [Pseudomonadaceae bacterium]
MRRARLPRLATTLILLAVTLVPGCIAYERSQSVVPDRVAKASDGVQLGKTPGSWLIETLGAPDSIQSGDGGDVWRYAVDTSARTTLQALPLIHVAVASEQQTQFCFEITDGVIARQWRE